MPEAGELNNIQIDNMVLLKDGNIAVCSEDDRKVRNITPRHRRISASEMAVTSSNGILKRHVPKFRFVFTKLYFQRGPGSLILTLYPHWCLSTCSPIFQFFCLHFNLQLCRNTYQGHLRTKRTNDGIYLTDTHIQPN